MPIPLTLIKITPLYGAIGPEPTTYSIRGATEEWSNLMDNPSGNQIRRSINGVPMDLTYDQFRKFKISLSCTDFEAFAWDGAKQGALFEYEAAAEFSFRTASGSPTRSVVTGSTRTDGTFTFYRPKLTCVVMDFRQSFQEWESKYSWTLDFEEY